ALASVDYLPCRADRCSRARAVDRRRRRIEVDEVVLEMDDELVARLQPQGRRRLSIQGEIAVTAGSIRQLLIMDAEIGFEDAVAAAQFRRLRDCASGFGTDANVLRCVRN